MRGQKLNSSSDILTWLHIRPSNGISNHSSRYLSNILLLGTYAGLKFGEMKKILIMIAVVSLSLAWLVVAPF